MLGFEAGVYPLRRKREPRPSPYLASGAPKRCAHCASPFRVQNGVLACWRGERGYYCSETCVEEAREKKAA